jgi:Fic family protein
VTLSSQATYQPPFTLTAAILRLAAEISEAVGRLSAREETARELRLRRLNRIRTVQGSLAIEGNTLNEEEITAILEGKRILAPPREIQEACNALAAYARLEKWRPFSEKDLLEAHRTLMKGLLEIPGVYRSGGVGVLSGERVIHLAPPAERVPYLVQDLLHWLKKTDQHPLMAGSIFHYEFEFIHPFADGNGRLGRLWQTLILFRWNPLLAHIPVESLVHAHQAEYYQALRRSTDQTDSAPFVVFMLRMIREAVISVGAPQVTPQVTPQVRRLLQVIVGAMSREELKSKLGLQDRKSFQLRYLRPALADDLIEMTIPGKPNSRFQQYRLTSKGKKLLPRLLKQKK